MLSLHLIVVASLVIFICYLVLFAIAKAIWLSKKEPAENSNLGCTVHAVLLVVAFISGIIITNSLDFSGFSNWQIIGTGILALGIFRIVSLLIKK